MYEQHRGDYYIENHYHYIGDQTFEFAISNVTIQIVKKSISSPFLFCCKDTSFLLLLLIFAAASFRYCSSVIQQTLKQSISMFNCVICIIDKMLLQLSLKTLATVNVAISIVCFAYTDVSEALQSKQENPNFRIYLFSCVTALISGDGILERLSASIPLNVKSSMNSNFCYSFV